MGSFKALRLRHARELWLPSPLQTRLADETSHGQDDFFGPALGYPRRVSEPPPTPPAPPRDDRELHDLFAGLRERVFVGSHEFVARVMTAVNEQIKARPEESLGRTVFVQLLNFVTSFGDDASSLRPPSRDLPPRDEPLDGEPDDESPATKPEGSGK